MKSLILCLALVMLAFTVVQAQPGPPPEGTPSNLEHSLYCDGGDNYVTFGNLTNLLNADATSGSMSMWVKLNSTDNAVTYPLTDGGHFQIRQAPNVGLGSVAWSFCINSGGAKYTANITLVTGCGNSPPWYHIVCTWNNKGIVIPPNTPGNIQIYQDGIAGGAPTTITADIFSLATPFRIGGHQTGPTFTGTNVELTINRLEFWSIALDANQVDELYNDRDPIDPHTVSFAANLLHSYHFGNGTDVDPTVVDNTANPTQRDGTMMNGPIFISDAPY